MGCMAAVRVLGVTAALGIAAEPAIAGEADVLEVAIEAEAAGTYRFDVTVRHDDAGWDHYADAFEIVAADGTVLGTRILHHPHVDEQPFTRALTGVPIPEGVMEVTVRARDSVHGHGGATVAAKVPER